MADAIEADPDALTALADELTDALAGMDQELGDLSAALSLLSGQWSGDASDAYQRAQTDWLTSMDSLREWGAAAVALLHSVASRYTATESAVIARCG
ncbi:WXG100 family type VII secretion target [Microbacterium sp. 18062]|uniref:WXG100 family type VII secretion target n=1 Tax=Microbacterium sp. 18062 TaxID=2681410 RepID=UPI0013595C49|nr:WXG100 family type VII secretion target [Microbacterium sp. 18062]